MRKLNLGNRGPSKPGFVNLGLPSHGTPDVAHDPGVVPYPFADDEFDHVESDHCLEHVPDPFAVMKEVHRIAKPGATVVVRVPHFSIGAAHVGHEAGFDITFPHHFRKDLRAGYQGFDLATEAVRLHWLAESESARRRMSPPARFLRRGLDALFSYFANLHPFLCTRLWCFWVGGFDEVEFRMRVQK